MTFDFIHSSGLQRRRRARVFVTTSRDAANLLYLMHRLNNRERK